MCVFVCVRSAMCVLEPLEPEKGVGFPRAGVTGSCKLFDVDAGTLILVLCKCSSQLSHLCSPRHSF